jgi:uncharacterized Zn finger protein
MRLDTGVAVKFDVETLRALAGDDLFAAGEAHLERDQVRDLIEVDGGVSATVENDAAATVWVGIIDRVFTTECDSEKCPAGAVCAHSVAVALAAFGEGVSWTSIAAQADEFDDDLAH